MKIVALIKQVPEMEKVKFDRERGVIDRSSAGTEINPFDLNALEAATQIKEKLGAQVEVIALSMGPASAEKALKEAIARGADKGYLLSDRKFGGSDVKATSQVLAAGIKFIGDVDLVIGGLQTVDGDTGQVGSEVAEYSNIPNICSVTSINDVSAEKISVTADLWDGLYVKEATYPLLLTVTKEVNVPSLPSFKAKMKAKKSEITVLTKEDIADYVDELELGIKGSPTWVKKIVVPKLHVREGEIYRDNYDQAYNKLLDLFKNSKLMEV